MSLIVYASYCIIITLPHKILVSFISNYSQGNLGSIYTVTQLSGYNSVRCVRLHASCRIQQHHIKYCSFIVLLSPQLLRIVVLCLFLVAQFSTLPLPAARLPPTPVHWDSFWREWGLGHVRPRGHCVQDCGQGVPPDADVSEVCMELELHGKTSAVQRIILTSGKNFISK